jgi:transposase-like protein
VPDSCVQLPFTSPLIKPARSQAHLGIKAAVAKVMHATWQRCRVHFMRNALAHATRSGKRMISAFIGTAFAQEDAKSVKAEWRRVADQLRPKVKKLAELLDEAEEDVLAYPMMSVGCFPTGAFPASRVFPLWP